MSIVPGKLESDVGTVGGSGRVLARRNRDRHGAHANLKMLIPVLAAFSTSINCKDNPARSELDSCDLHRTPGFDGHPLFSPFFRLLGLIALSLSVHVDAVLAPGQRNLGHRNFMRQLSHDQNLVKVCEWLPGI